MLELKQLKNLIASGQTAALGQGFSFFVLAGS